MSYGGDKGQECLLSCSSGISTGIGKEKQLADVCFLGRGGDGVRIGG